MGIAAVFGALWGSFINVVIHRVPRGESLVSPPSRCPSCFTPIRPWHNVPVLGWLWLRGRCAQCRAPISPRYPLVELACSLLAAAVWTHLFDPQNAASTAIAAALHFAFILALVAVVFIDLDYRIIPHGLTVPFIVAGPLVALVAGEPVGLTWVDSTLGLAIGGGIIWLIIVGYQWVRGAEGMGGGDLMLMALLGGWLGHESILFVLFASSTQGTLAAVGLWLCGRTFPEPLPWPADTYPPGADPPDAGASDIILPAEPSSEDIAAQPEPTSTAPLGRLELPFGPFLVLAGLQWFFFKPYWQRLFAQLTGLGE